jgi:hypothetical protein
LSRKRLIWARARGGTVLQFGGLVREEREREKEREEEGYVSGL